LRIKRKREKRKKSVGNDRAENTFGNNPARGGKDSTQIPQEKVGANKKGGSLRQEREGEVGTLFSRDR